MATKRAPPKDLDVSSMQSKQLRLETMSKSSFFNTEPVSSASHTCSNKSSSLPKTELHAAAPVPVSPLTPKVSSSPTHVVGIPTEPNQGKISADFHSSEVDTASYVLPIIPTQKPPNITPALQQDSDLASLFVVPVSMKQQISVPQSQFVHSGLTKPGVVPTTSVDNHNKLMALSSGAFVPIAMLNPPPYNTACSMPNVSGIAPTKVASELLPCTDMTSELSCSSPSQLLHLPVSNSSSHLSSSTSSPALLSMNRQPVCLIESNGKEGPKKDKKTMKYRVLKHRRAKLASLKLKHEVDLKEKFFLESGGNMMDIVTWKKKPNLKRDKYLKLYDIESEASSHDQCVLSPVLDNSSICPDVEPTFKCEAAVHKHDKHSKQQKAKSEGAEGTSVTSTTIQIPLSTVSRSLRAVTPSSPIKTPQFPTTSPRPVTRLHSSFSSFYETSHEDIVMRARHEAEVMRAIGELRKEGLWSSSRLPKVQEPLRKKTHWDYLLEEMQWLATDFANERRWKINAAKKISRSVSGYYRELEMQQVRTEKEEALKLKKIALSIAKEIKHFWDSIQKVVAHKQQLLLEEKKKRAMDMHLEFIVDQTAKYSNWLVKGLTTTSSTATPSEPSLHSAAASIEDSDAFLTPEETSDDEETIEKEEQLMETEDGNSNYTTEIKALQEEGEMPLEQLLASLPPELLKKDWMEIGEETKGEEVMMSIDDRANSCVGEKESNVEKIETAPEVEEAKLQKNIADVDEGKDHDIYEDGKDGGINSAVIEEGGRRRIQELSMITKNQKETKKEVFEYDSHDESLDERSTLSEDSGDEGDSEASYGEEESEENKGLEYLVSGKRIEEVCQTEAGFSDVAAVAERFQPKGITLATTEVKTNIPFLLKHSLREYQHIGLDWLVAMHEKRLNGILADEMGLGKTIQTIALLAHLACEEANWGPHLIVVPTSVMLNWEYELKKWCPAFKLLTYFGSFKERKQKRVGWTKRNAFHVCITSYNIAVTDHRAFKQMKWKYLVLDEAQNIKNFKSQRWQTLLAFNSQRRLLLTGTPLQNNLMELWSLMHFLMPSVFSSHSDFKEWFSNPLTGMVEGSQEYNDSIVKRLHQVLRPFLLRRLKMEVEKQMPKKYEHVIMCRLSKRQRFLYNEYMSRRKTKDTLAAGNYLSVINILMQLRKVCNHPDLFELRPILSPLRLSALEFYAASLLFSVYEHDPFKHVSLDHLNLQLASYELDTEAFAAFRSRQLQAPKALICDPLRSQSDTGEDKDEEEQERNCLCLEDLHLPYLSYSRQEWALSRRRHMHEVNSRRCRRIPMYGIDLVKAVRNMSEFSSKRAISPPSWSTFQWLWSGYMACKRQQVCTLGWEDCSILLQALLPTYERRTLAQKEILKRFIITVPPVTAPSVTLHTFLYTPARLSHDSLLTERIARHLAPHSSIFHDACTSMSLQFPETRLIQYDCGKLQTLDVLLRDLKAGNHRVLIFTQMARVLDILEIFLNYHGHTYLRLDGATPVQKRQVLMDQFNRDERIFCFILSTRSGGLGVNLTGADTVVFYDSDWNPTMDAQAQDRCHRIGQTRDVHIYRLVCESTVEENILKKANQKRMLGDIAIEGGVFTTDFFREATLRDLFRVKSDVQSSIQSHHPVFDPQTETSSLTSKYIEDLLMQAEDENDAQAASMAKAEQVAEKAEFDEDFCAQVDREDTSERHPGLESSSKALTVFATIEHQLSGVERYAMRYLEEENAEVAAEQLKIAEESIEQAKKSWELSHMQSLREEEERMAEEDAEDDIVLSYDRPELANKIFIDKGTGEEMPVWLPPTPPVDDGDELYVDIMLDMAYDTSSIITPAELASIAPFSEEDYDVLGLSRRHLEIESNKKPQKSTSKQVLKEHVNVPPSLFWRRYATDTLSTKLKKLASHQKKLKAKDQFTPLLEQQPEGPEWSHYEDWLLLKGIAEVLEFPLSLAITVPAQMPNWSIIADLISLLSQVRRSPLQCREHLMNVVIPREDSFLKGDDSIESKKHKSKDGVSKKVKSRKEQKIKHTMVSDGGKEQTNLFTTSFNKVLETVSKRKQTTKFSLDSVQKPSIHADLLKDYGIRMESVLSPMQIAHRRAERIQSEPPRSSQVHQLLAQPYHVSLMRGYAAAAAAAGGAPLMKSTTGYNFPRQVSTSVAISTAPTQRFQPVSSTSTSFTSSQLPQVTTTTIPSPVLSTVSQATPSSSTTSQQSTPLPLLPAKTFNVASVSDISKTLRGNITHQQLLLLRQSTLQQQANANHPQSSTHLTRPLIAQQQTTPSVPTPSPSVTQKVALPSGIEQLRASIALPTQQRFGAITSVSGGRGLAAGRTLQTEDVLALLKQQSLRIAATQSYKAGHAVPSQLHPQTHFQFRSEPGHSTSKVQQVPTAVVPPEAIKLVSTSAMSVSDATQAQQQKVERVDQNQGGITAKQFSAAPTTAAINIPFGPQQPSSSVITTAAQNLVKAQIQQVLAQQQLKTQHGAQLPKTTSQ